ncbi:MAG: deoxyribose-phosphate aldolase [Gammaproteobacteria bacterium]|nr:deoxyribose-phosphate aldolase [Gammaproteobacteria bacterium]
MLLNPKQLVGLLDYTRLNNDDSAENIIALCQAANTIYGPTAAVCVMPEWIKQTKQILSASNIKIASVANFPTGKQTLETTLKEIKQSLIDGADEIDVVMPYHDFLAGDTRTAITFLKACRQTCGDCLLKVILETGALDNKETIYQAALLAIDAGADFIKTSTGKIAQGASIAAAKAMIKAIKTSPRDIGLKISGGVRDIKTAEQYLKLFTDGFGKDKLTPKHFRFGVSQLIIK